MGDHRFDCEIKFTMHGKTYTFGPCYLNWFDYGDGIDTRIADFFRESSADALSRYDEEVAKLHEREHAAETERAEKAELSRLQAKYPPQEPR